MLPVARVLQLASLVKSKGMRISNESSFVNSVPVCGEGVSILVLSPVMMKLMLM